MSIFFSSCTTFENKDIYKIKVGETFQIYYSSNSSTYFTLDKKEKLTKIKLLDNKKVDNFNNECEGCTTNYAYIFKGIVKGEETIALTEKVISIEGATFKIYKYKVIVE